MSNLKPFQAASEPIASANDPRPTQTRIRVHIPRQYHHEPVISNLIQQHGLTVNILAAMLGANAHGGGWFDLELQGTAAVIQAAMFYLNDLNLEVWHDAETEGDGW